MNTLFATTVATAKPKPKDYKLSDGSGLYLLVRPNGSKLWRCRIGKVGGVEQQIVTWRCKETGRSLCE